MTLFVFSPPLPYCLHAQFPSVDQFRDLCYHNSSYPHVVWSFSQFFDHDVNSYPYYDVPDEFYARLNVMIQTVNEWHEHFICEIRECGLLYETNPSAPSSRLKASLYEYCKYSLPLEFNFVDDTALIDLEKVFDSILPWLLYHLLLILFLHAYRHYY